MSSLVSKMAPILTTAGSEARLVSTATQNNNNNRKSKQAEKDDDDDNDDDDDDTDDENVDDIEVRRREKPSCGNPWWMDGNTAEEDDVAWRGVNELSEHNIGVVPWRDFEDISWRGVEDVG